MDIKDPRIEQAIKEHSQATNTRIEIVRHMVEKEELVPRERGGKLFLLSMLDQSYPGCGIL